MSGVGSVVGLKGVMGYKMVLSFLSKSVEERALEWMPGLDVLVMYM